MKLDKFLSSLDIDELKAFYKDVVSSNPVLINKIRQEIALSDEFYNKKCSVCGNPLSSVKEPLVIEFGPKDMRTKAIFCGADCLQYFVEFLLVKKETPPPPPKLKKKVKRKRKGFFASLFS